MNPLRAWLEPYLATIRLVLSVLSVLALLGIGFWIGCRWSAGEVADAERARDQAQAQASDWKAAADAKQGAIDAQNASNSARLQALSAVMASAAQAERKANEAADAFLRRREALEREHAADHATPGCAEQMGAPVCGSPLR